MTAFVESETGTFFNMALVKKVQINESCREAVLIFIDNTRAPIPLKQWEEFYASQQSEPQSEPKADDDAPVTRPHYLGSCPNR